MFFMKIMKVTIMMNIIISYTFMIFSNHPMVLGLVVIIQAVYMSIYMYMKSTFSWISFLMFMIFLGGILMVFCYIISISFSKEKLVKKKSSKKIILFSLMMVFFMPKKKEVFMILKTLKFEKLIMSSFSSSWKMSMMMMSLLIMIMMLSIMITELSKNSVRKIS